MYKVGVFAGKFLPPHRGHLHAIIQASTKCEKLYVVVSHHEHCDDLCREAGLKPMPMKLRARWLSTELSDLDHIEVVMLDESGIPFYPYGWEEWSSRLHNLIPEEIDVIFGGEPEYSDGYTKYFPNCTYALYDVDRTKYPISATKIREDYLKYWDYILGSARPFFTKRILITGTESCAKTTLTKMLAKVYHTSWAREEGRYHSTKHFGANDNVFEVEDFFNICWEQREVENHALKTSNKIVFFDTDATVTQYYCKQYMGEYNPKIEAMVDPSRYDYVFLMKPSVRWVDDGFRFLSGDDLRYRLHEELKQMYIERGFAHKIIEIGGDYHNRLNTAIDLCNSILEIEVSENE